MIKSRLNYQQKVWCILEGKIQEEYIGSGLCMGSALQMLDERRLFTTLSEAKQKLQTMESK